MIPYNYADDMIVATHRDLLITDGTVTVSGTGYTVSGDTVTITNEYLEQESFELHQSICSESQLRYGSCESNYITFVMHDNIPTVKGKVLKVYLIPDNDASKMLQLGVFTAQEDELSADRTVRTITAYDAMYDILNSDVAAWYNALLPTSSDTCTLAQFRFAFTAHFNLTQETISLPNDSMVVKRTIEPESLSGADVIKAICELEGCFGTISNEGKFKYVVLTPGLDDGLFPSETLYPADDLYPQDVNHDVTVLSKAAYIDVEFEDYNSEAITELTIRTDDSDVGTTVGTSGNTYVIQGNFLVYGKTAAQLTTIGINTLSNMANRYYKPCTVNALGNPLLEPGDGIRVRTKYRGIVTYILERNLTGIQALRDTYTSNGEEECDQELNSLSTQFKKLSNATVSMKSDIEGFKIEVSDDYVSKAGVVTDLNAKMSSSIEITPSKISFNSSGTLVIDTTNFSLEANGNATFKGVLDGATIKTGTSLYAYNSGSSQWATMSSLGFFINSGGGIEYFEARPNDLYLRTASNRYANLHIDDFTQTSSLSLYGNGNHVYIGSNGTITSSNTLALSGSFSASTDITVGSIFGACVYIDTGSVLVGGFQSGATSITSGGGVDTPALTVGGHSLSYYEVLDTNGNTVHVLGY